MQEEAFKEYRENLKVVFVSLYSLKPFYPRALDLILQMLEHLKGHEAEAGPRNLELAASLVFWAAEGKAENVNFKDGGPYI